MLDFKQYLTPKSVVKLIQLLQSGQQTAYEISIQNVKSYVTDYAILYCMPDTVFALYSALTPEQKKSANFHINGKDISYSSDVLYFDTGLCGAEEVALTFSESDESIWYFLKLLFSYDAAVVVDDVVSHIRNINFSYSTPTLSIGIPSKEGFRTKLLWSYEAYRVVDSTTFRCSPELAKVIQVSKFASYVELSEPNGDMVDMTIAIQSLPGIALAEEHCRLAFNMSYMLDCLARFEEYQCLNEGLSIAYKYVRWLNGIRFKPADYSSSGRQTGYAKNIKIKRDILRPSNRKVFEMLSEDDGYFRDKMKNLSEDDLIEYAKLFLARCNNILGDYWALGFTQVCDGSNTIREHEYFEASAMAKSLAFDVGIEWFKAKIQMLEYKLQYYCTTPYPFLGGSVSFIWEAVYEL